MWQFADLQFTDHIVFADLKLGKSLQNISLKAFIQIKGQLLGQF
jgi:hypothetical protein